jgi:deferrochelatase/peroxidase EfeB
MLRRGIPYGEELSEEEIADKKTQKERGLAFACYMSSIADGFKIVQKCMSLFVLLKNWY